MPSIVCSETTLHKLRRCAPAAYFRQTATPRPDGNFDVPIEDDTLEVLNRYRIAGETDDAAVLKLIAAYEKARGPRRGPPPKLIR